MAADEQQQTAGASPPTQPPPPSPPPPPQASDGPYHGTPVWLHNAMMAAGILSVVGLMLPPRRLRDLRTAVLSGGLYMSTSQLVHDWTGRSLYRRTMDRLDRLEGGDLPERAQRNKLLMDAERARRDGPTAAELKKRAWLDERTAREREAAESGRGLWGLISDQVWEVWTGADSGKSDAAKGRKDDDGKK